MTEDTSNIHNLLNSIVDGRIDDFDVNLEEGKLKGENFLGEIIFVSLKNKKTNETLHLVVKQILDGLGNVEAFKQVYPTEINFYEIVWPTLNKFQDASSIGFNKIAKCYKTCGVEGKEKLILEDLHYQDYKLLDKTKALDRKHVDYIFKSYGTFHAISYAYRELYPEEFAKMENLTNKRMFSGKDFKESAEKRNENPFEPIRALFDEKKDENLLKLFDSFVANKPVLKFFDCMKYKGDTPVLLHGDCWSNNMMFKYDEEENIVGMKFLDFQLINYGSPVKDLSYCLYSGASKDILDQLDDLLQTYIDSFTQTLQKLNCTPDKPYTLETLKTEWKEYSFFGFFMGMGIWKIKLLDKDNIPKMTDLADDKKNNFALPPVAKEHLDTYNNLIKDLIVHYYEIGLL